MAPGNGPSRPEIVPRIPFRGPNRLWSLWDMHTWFTEFNDVMGLVRWMEVQHKKPATLPMGLFGLGMGGANALAAKSADAEPIAASPITASDLDLQKGVLGVTSNFCRQLEADSALKRAARLSDVLKQGWLPTYESCHSEWKALREAIEDDIKDRYAQYMSRDYAKLVLGIEAEWQAPLSAFPVRDEIADAAKCLGVNQPTACVFHLMRAMEVAVRRLAKRFKLPTGQNATWVVLTGNMTDKIATWKKDTEARRNR